MKKPALLVAALLTCTGASTAASLPSPPLGGETVVDLKEVQLSVVSGPPGCTGAECADSRNSSATSELERSLARIDANTVALHYTSLKESHAESSAPSTQVPATPLDLRFKVTCSADKACSAAEDGAGSGLPADAEAAAFDVASIAAWSSLATELSDLSDSRQSAKVDLATLAAAVRQRQTAVGQIEVVYAASTAATTSFTIAQLPGEFVDSAFKGDLFRATLELGNTSPSLRFVVFVDGEKALPASPGARGVVRTTGLVAWSRSVK